MPIPDPGANLHVVSLDYACTFGAMPASGGKVLFAVPDPVQFTFLFETGSTENPPGVLTYTWDYTWFDQAATETAITTALGTISGAVASLLGVTTLAVEQVISVRRIWTTAPNVQGPGVSSGRIVLTDSMPYTPTG